MAYSVETYDSILAGILRDIRSLLPEADIGTDSDHYVRSAAVAAAIEGIYQRLAWLYRQIFPDTADAAELLRHAANRGLTQKAAVSSTSTIAVSGAPGTELPEGSAIRHITSGQLFLVLTSATLGVDGRATAPVAAQSAGAAQNGLTGSLSLVSPPLGIDATASFTAPTAGGRPRVCSIALSSPSRDHAATTCRWCQLRLRALGEGSRWRRRRSHPPRTAWWRHCRCRHHRDYWRPLGRGNCGLLVAHPGRVFGHCRRMGLRANHSRCRCVGPDRSGFWLYVGRGAAGRQRCLYVSSRHAQADRSTETVSA